MSLLKTSVFLTINLLVIVQLAQCTEFIPVYMWGTGNINKRVPALHRITQDSFKDDILEDLKDDTFVVVFAEHTLSPEDFSVRDGSGYPAFPYLSKLRKDSKTTYLPYVQNPIKALKHLNKDVTEVSIEKLRQSIVVPSSRILIVNLNDAHDDEQRFSLLQRHDSEVITLYNEILKKRKNVLALYTAHHTSWVGSEEIIESRKTRSLLQAQDPATDDSTNKYFKDPVFVYISGDATFTEGTSSSNVSLTFSATKVDSVITLTGKGTNLQVDFKISNTSSGYWQMESVQIAGKDETVVIKTNSTIYAPYTFSYACGDQVFKNNTLSLFLPRFQIQPLYKAKNETKFDDPYNCVGFTTVPIWSGLFVTFILLLIMTFGLTMIMDIKTMDRFDDPKGKTITINAAE